MDHHNGRGQELNSLNEFGKGIVSQGEPKVGKPKGNTHNQEYLKNRKDTVQNRCDNVHKSPTVVHQVVLVRQDPHV